MFLLMTTFAWGQAEPGSSPRGESEYGQGASPDDDARLGPGDRITIRVHGLDFGTDGLLISDSGEVSFPYLGRLQVAGLTQFEAERFVREKLMDGYLVDPQVAIQVQSFRSRRIDVIGAVKAPGLYYLDGPTTVRSIVAKAGGAQLERSSGVVIVRRDKKFTEIPLDDLETDGGDFILEGGDVVDVDVGRAVFLTGEVARPGTVAFQPGLTAAQAIIQAGGESRFARLTGTYIVRDEERIPVNLKRILKGKAADMQLEPGDRIVVPTSAL